MAKIKEIKARKIKDSRGQETVEVELEIEKTKVVASCPSGKSTGKNEAVALSASMAVKNVNKIIAPKLKGADPSDQKKLDLAMIKLDGTENKSKLGANAILPVSMAICRAGAVAQKLSFYKYINKLSNLKSEILNLKLPLPMFNFIEGGAHANNDLDFQEFMVVPQRESFGDNLSIANKIFNNLKDLIVKGYNENKLGDEGGFAPPISKTEQALLLLKNAIGNEDVAIAIDAAASQFYENGKYVLEGREFSRNVLIDFYKDLTERFKIISIEDPFSEDDWQGFKELNYQFSISNFKTFIIGDDLTTTNVEMIKEAHSKNACNGIIIKPNQIGTVTESIEAARLAKSYGWKVIISHRSGETMDSFIADLSVGLEADFIKSGSPSQPERMVKYSRLMEIENELKNE
jgi:enolase